MAIHIQSSENQCLSFRNAISSILSFTILFFTIWIARIVLSPLMVLIQTEMGFSHSKAGQLFFFIALGSSLGLLCSGFISGLIVHRWTIFLAPFLSGLGLIAAALCKEFFPLSLACFGTGCATGLYFPSAVYALTSIVRREDWGKAMAIHEIGPDLCFVLTPVLVEFLLLFLSWRGVLIQLGFFHLVVSLAFLRFGQGGTSRGEVPKPSVIWSIIKRSEFWILTSLFGLAVGVSIGPYAMLPLYLTSEHSFDRQVANNLLAVSRISGLFMAFIAGYIADHIGTKKTLFVYFLVIGPSTALIGVAQNKLLWFAILTQPIIAAFFFPVGFSAASRSFETNIRSIAFSLLTPACALIGQGIVPAMLGFLGERGNFGIGFVFLGGTTLLGLPLLHFLRSSSGVCNCNSVGT